MANAFVEKLSGHAALTAEDTALLAAACTAQRDFPARCDLIREGDKPGPLFVILEGWACRYKMLPEGTRQITAFLMPGDFCDMHASVLEEMDHSIATLTPARIAFVSRGEIEDLIDYFGKYIEAPQAPFIADGSSNPGPAIPPEDPRPPKEGPDVPPPGTPPTPPRPRSFVSHETIP